ncbi:hypothetical protein BpHYR1_027365, partial [Brachionus plicatilis]
DVFILKVIIRLAQKPEIKFVLKSFKNQVSDLTLKSFRFTQFIDPLHIRIKKRIKRNKVLTTYDLLFYCNPAIVPLVQHPISQDTDHKCISWLLYGSHLHSLHQFALPIQLMANVCYRPKVDDQFLHRLESSRPTATKCWFSTNFWLCSPQPQSHWCTISS